MSSGLLSLIECASCEGIAEKQQKIGHVDTALSTYDWQMNTLYQLAAFRAEVK